MENFEEINREEAFTDVNNEYVPSPGTMVMLTETSVLPQLPTHCETPKTETKPKPKSTARKVILFVKGTMTVLAYLSVFACLALLLLTYQNQEDIMQQLQRSQVAGAANPPLASAPLSYITVGGCTQVQLTLSQYSGGFVMQACWGSSCGEPAVGDCQPQVMQQAFANFEATNPTCLSTTTTPSPATSNPVPTTSSQSNYYITIGGCTQVYVFQYSGTGQNYVSLSWNGYGSSAYGATLAVALQQATAEFEAQNPPCLAGTTTGPAPATSNPVPTTSSQSSYYITIGGCTQVTVFQWSGSGQNYVSLSWNGYGCNAYGATVAEALQQATAEFEAQNPPCLIGTTTGPAPATSTPVPTTGPQYTYYVTMGRCTPVLVTVWGESGAYYVSVSYNNYSSSSSAATLSEAMQLATAKFEVANPLCMATATTAPSAAVHCPAYVPPYTAELSQIYEGYTTPYVWTISLSSPVSQPPVNQRACWQAGYISQYNAVSGGDSCVMVASVQTASPTVEGNHCIYSYSDNGNRVFMTLALSCDTNAIDIKFDSPVQVISKTVNGYLNYYYTFTGKYAGVCGAAPTTFP